MRALGVSLALSCELAETPRCRCRCGGALHGARRVTTSSGVEGLPEGDPHHPFAEELGPPAPHRPRPAPPGQMSLIDQHLARVDELIDRGLAEALLANGEGGR